MAKQTRSFAATVKALRAEGLKAREATKAAKSLETRLGRPVLKKDLAAHPRMAADARKAASKSPRQAPATRQAAKPERGLKAPAKAPAKRAAPAKVSPAARRASRVKELASKGDISYRQAQRAYKALKERLGREPTKADFKAHPRMLKDAIKQATELPEQETPAHPIVIKTVDEWEEEEEWDDPDAVEDDYHAGVEYDGS
jgi:hypothetical protein